jgi:hypothetical protein
MIGTRTAKFSVVLSVNPARGDALLRKDDLQYRMVIELDEGRVLAIENHQDFGSDELSQFCETTRGLGICLDTGNTFPVAEAPLARTAYGSASTKTPTVMARRNVLII